MSTHSNVQVVQALFAAMGRGDLHAVQALTADDIEWIVPGDWALAGTHRGHAGLTDFFRIAAGQVETVISTPLQFVAQADRVLVIGSSTGTIKATNHAFKDDFILAVTVRHGKVSYIREYIDTLALALASGMAAANHG